MNKIKLKLVKRELNFLGVGDCDRCLFNVNTCQTLEGTNCKDGFFELSEHVEFEVVDVQEKTQTYKNTKDDLWKSLKFITRIKNYIHDQNAAKLLI